MTVTERIYRLTHKKAIKNGKAIPYFWKYSIFTIIAKPIRKFFSAVIIPTIPFAGMRISAYRMCGYKIGKNCFIGMRCYLDDMCYDKIKIGNNVTISYGVFFACHGRKQGHNEINIEDNAYIGMNASIVARTPITIGQSAVVGACTLVNKNIPAQMTAVGIPARIISNNNGQVYNSNISGHSFKPSDGMEGISQHGEGNYLNINYLLIVHKCYITQACSSAG